ncbi:WYL domain-containing protein [Acinetobacter sp. VNK23]|uniref:helix-turn-helix transcriptional regulator n=1 Tax=Acinetobacter thutiue TaxID=2998078 RepID=UPI002574D722|nr:WYL domain-containing protein [Acinetobacter thutiue]MDM1019489.1 WYL domain-containing protein [Acinetobacter thutiue]
MAKNSERSEKLADRLATMLVMLDNGESLNLKELAIKFEVSERTLARDISRLKSAKLDLGLVSDLEGEQKYRTTNKVFKLKDIQKFAKISGAYGVYPELKPSFLKKLLADDQQSVYEAKGHAHENAKTLSKLLSMLSEAIEKCQTIQFLYNGQLREVEPYRLIHHHGSWYLAAVRKGKLLTYRVSRIARSYQQHELSTFEPNPDILKQLEDEDSIWFGQEKSEVILKVHADVVLHFMQRQLLPGQELVKTLEDGGILVSSKISHAMQLLPLVRYWIPHVEIISPEHLQDELETGLKGYLER